MYMNKITFITPCLMTENSRQANYKAFDLLESWYPEAHHCIHAQEWTDEDFKHFSREGVEFIGNNTKLPSKLAGSRNLLLKWFYESDYDYAIWRDSTDSISKPSYNDFLTVVNALKNGDFKANQICTTVGAAMSADRLEAKKAADIFENTTLVPDNQSQSDCHFTIIANIKKLYGKEVYMDEVNFDPYHGIYEDRYLCDCIKYFGECYLIPCVSTSKVGGTKASIWRSNTSSGKAEYPPYDRPRLAWLEKEYMNSMGLENQLRTYGKIKLPRIEKFKDLVSPYKARKKSSSFEDLF